jgi:hypothetical protein
MPETRVLPLIAVIAVLACANPQAVDLEAAGEGPQGAGVWSEVFHGVSARADATGIQVRNGGAAPIYIFAADRAIVPLINWAVCTEPALCTSVQPGTTRHFASSAVAGWGTSDETTIFWWRLVPAGDGRFEPDAVRALRVRR